jgi:hypothetical protein
VGTWLGRIGLVWLLASVLTMVILSVFVFMGSRRKRLSEHGPSYVTFDVPAQVYQLNPRRATEAELHAEPAINHQVNAESGALDRLLAGVSLPCELERLYVDGEDDRLRMAFQTKGYEAREVAVSVVDELERMGMDVEPLSYTEARAFRDGFEIAVSIYLEPARVIRDRRLAFPGADSQSIVLEFSVV